MAALTLVICLPVTAATNSTTLTTTVPEVLTLFLELSGNGTVTVSGVTYTKSETVDIPRNSIVELQIIPDVGNDIKSVVYNSYDYTKEVKNGKLTLPTITGEAKLCVSFIETASTPQTGYAYSPLCLTVLMFLSLIGIIVLYFGKKKTN